MNSINKNQPEHNYENLEMAEAIKKIKDLTEKSDTCFFCTKPSSDESMGTRPMSIQKTDESGTMWFVSANDSHTNEDIKYSPEVKLYFQGSTHSDFLYIEGKATVSANKDEIKELWKPLMKVWFTEGEDDPRISIIKVKPTTGYYWDTKHGNTVAFLKMIAGAAMGKTLDDSIEGNLKV
ncbi:general stress protein [Taibaiella lutea]|uniref:General stress protein n=1 Tax=Taibaiella lutea TaxID=2608001 RepID=A0A5M6CN47_9BACT|nr:pyridoxamine 5'-phosphate oxidase family protein [Taibaiella lutea]KAA5536463.1 general stress protein [Taibaiella lutea]